MLPDYDLQVLKLTPQFYLDYPNPPYAEIEKKESRRYNCLLIQTHYDYFICVPFRSRVKHKYCYHFTSSKRSKIGQSALDYSKIIIVKDTRYIDNVQGIIDSDEYTEMMQHIDRIVKDAVTYVEDYVAYKKRADRVIAKEEFQRRYKYSTLPYFDELLGIDKE